MQFSLELDNSKLNAVLTHGEERLEFSVSAFAKETLEEGYDIFLQINEYWKQMEHFRRDQTFVIYKAIKSAFEDPDLLDLNLLTIKLQELVGQLYALHPMDDARHWVIFKSENTRIPDSLKEVYQVNNDQPGSREQTYLRDEYIDLVTYSVLSRLMFPIWGEYLPRSKSDVGNTYKEYKAYSLLARTEMMYSAAAQKLRRYIEANSPPDAPSSAIIGGMSSEDYPVWVLSLVVTRRVCIGDLRGIDVASPKLVRYIYNFVIQKVQGSESNFANVGKVNPKTMDMAGSDEEDSGGSRFESYKIREEITIGDKVFLGHSLTRDIIGESLKIVADLDVVQLRRALETAKELEHVDLNDAQVTLAQWIFKAVVSPRAFDYFAKPLVVQTLAASQVILWHWGYKELAMLATAKPAAEREGRTVRVSSQDAKKYGDQLTQLFPYPKRATRATRDKTDQVMGAFDLMAELFNTNDWRTTIDTSMLQTIQKDNPTRLFTTPTNIKARLAQLIVDHVSKLTRSNPYNILPGTGRMLG